MSLFEDTNPRALKELLSDIHFRKMALPDFQRSFVWDPSATQDLIVSIASGYPAGSLLRVRDPHQMFAAREFQGAPELDGHRYTYLVLDGQQRLTSLYQAFYGVGDHRYFLDLKRLLDGNEFEEAIFHERATTARAKALQEFETQASDLVLPLSVIKGGGGGFFEWVMRVSSGKSPEEMQALQKALMRINEEWIQTIDDYTFPVVTLAESTKAAAICTIFETLNMTGVKLSVFELLTARFWPDDIRLRDWWATAQQQHPLIAEFEVDPYYLLQSIALACRKSPACKRSDVLDLTADEIKAWWSPVVKALGNALAMLQDDCKVMRPKWLPYYTMLVPLAAVLAKAPMPTTADAGVRREKLKRWFWCAVFGQAYENAPNSHSARDVTELVDWLEGGKVPETVSSLRFDPKALRDVTPRQRAIYRGTICLILSAGGGARDFHTGSAITRALINEQGIDDHHVFPDAFLKSRGVQNEKARNCVLNRTLIDKTTNQMIGCRAPSDYMSQVRDTPGFPLGEVLASHCLPADASSPLWTDDFDGFLSWRQERLWVEIQRATGLVGATDLEIVEFETA